MPEQVPDGSAALDPTVCIEFSPAGFLAALPGKLRSELVRGSQRVEHPAGAVISIPGSPARPGVVLAALVRVYISWPDGREATLRYARPGEAMGLGGVLVEDNTVGMQALADTAVLYFSRADFRAALSADVALARAVAQDLAGRSIAASGTLGAFAFASVRERVADHLLTLAVPDRHGRLVAAMTQQALADAVGSVRDVVTRALRELSDAGMVVTSHGKVVITDRERLRREAAPG